MVVFRDKDLVEHHKLVLRREQGVYLGTGSSLASEHSCAIQHD